MATQSESRRAQLKSESEDKMDLNTLFKFIKPFDGSRDKLVPFINNCQNAHSLASKQRQPILLKYILSQLESTAESACAIKEFETWEQLSEFLSTQFGERKHYSALLSDLQNCYQGSDSVNKLVSL